ncbi:MAG: NADH-quinone oxidoreductase subunit D [Prevotellamassilia sp.]|nr:NADH-quinone oxidoreductase subunit D [Prevotellamassilia sp.]
METTENKTQAPAAAVTAPKPAVAKPAPKPAAPAVPAENEVKLIVVEPAALRAEMERQKAEGMDFLECLTGVDWMEEGLGCIYTLTSTTTGKMVHIQTATLDRENPLLPSVSDLWAVANIYEREVFDFYGIRFTGHPDMRRVFLREDWVGYPFRKDDETEKNNPLRMTNEPLADDTEELTLNADGTVTSKRNTIFADGDYVVNIGPQHPSTHGVLHFRVALEGETIKKIDPILGYIHRGIEKIDESLTYPQTLALTDRMDYLGAMQNRHALCMCIEKALGVEVSDRVKVIRTMMDELQRIDSHILFFSCLAQDLGATTAFLYGFRDREKILDIFEETCGGRLILNYNTIGGVMHDLHPNFVPRVKELIPYLRNSLKELHALFTGNVIFQNRAKGVGVLTKEQAISYGCTGGTGRAAGWHNDLRKTRPYAAYDRVKFNEVVREGGDSFDRYMIRMDEILESLNILEQLVDNIPEGSIQEKMKPIIKVPEGTYYSAVEGSRGIFGVMLISKGDKSPYRLHYRSTGLPLVAAMDTLCSGSMLADLITIGGTVDYIVPDVDR